MCNQFQTEGELRQQPDGDSSEIAGKIKFHEAVRRVRIDAQVGAISLISAHGSVIVDVAQVGARSQLTSSVFN